MYYFLPPDAVTPAPPLIPRRMLKSYENVKLQDNGHTALETTNKGPPLPPRKASYENVDLKEKGSQGASLPGPNPPVPFKRARVTRHTPPRGQEICTVTPPLPQKVLDLMTSDKSKLLKSTSVPYQCPISQDSPQFPPKERSGSVPFLLPLKQQNDNLTTKTPPNPSPYYSLPPDSALADVTFDDFGIEGSSTLDDDDSDDGPEAYITLDEQFSSVDSRNEGSQGQTLQSAPPLPPKVGT